LVLRVVAAGDRSTCPVGDGGGCSGLVLV
jgi:hypothetical protein